jgi:hypothetical protein
MNRPDILLFPLDTDNVKLTEVKQYLGAKASIAHLEASMQEATFGSGWWRELQDRATACREFVNKTEVKYGLS